MAGRFEESSEKKQHLFRLPSHCQRDYMGEEAVFVTIIQVLFCLLSLVVGLLDVDKNKV